MPRTRVNAAPWSPRFDAHPRFEAVLPGSALLHSFDDFPSVEALDAALAARLPTREGGGRYQLVRDAPRSRRRSGPPRERYDVLIDRDGTIPTREANWHDLLNAVVWASFPRAKSRVSARQRRLHAQRDASATATHHRDRSQDALALLDEGGVLAVCTRAEHAAVCDALAQGPDALWSLEAAGRARVLIFGHAVYEHLVHGAVSRAAVHPVALDALPDELDALRAAADLALAARLDDPADLLAPGPYPAAPVAL
ncbi:MAG: DUF3025 domain-containing protein [Polyangiales bacterium]